MARPARARHRSRCLPDRIIARCRRFFGRCSQNVHQARRSSSGGTATEPSGTRARAFQNENLAAFHVESPARERDRGPDDVDSNHIVRRAGPYGRRVPGALVGVATSLPLSRPRTVHSSRVDPTEMNGRRFRMNETNDALLFSPTLASVAAWHAGCWPTRRGIRFCTIPDLGPTTDTEASASSTGARARCSTTPAASMTQISNVRNSTRDEHAAVRTRAERCTS